MGLKPMDRVLVRGHAGNEIEGIVVNLNDETVGITTPAEREKAAQSAREPITIGFPARDVRLNKTKAAKP